jgi:hypothetical protein
MLKADTVPLDLRASEDIGDASSLDQSREVRPAFGMEIARAFQVAAMLLFMASPSVTQTSLALSENLFRKDNLTITWNTQKPSIVHISITQALRIARAIRNEAEQKRLEAAEMDALEALENG